MGKDIEPRRRFEVGKHKSANPLPGVQEALSELEQLPNIVHDQSKLDQIAQLRAGLEEVQDLARTLGVELVTEPKQKRGLRKLFSRSAKEKNEISPKPETFMNLEVQTIELGKESIKLAMDGEFLIPHKWN